MPGPAHYLLDANALIQAHRAYYRFGVCPGFWLCISWHHKQNTISSIDKVKSEIAVNKDRLSHWVDNKCPKSFFERTSAVVNNCYEDAMRWVYSQPNYTNAAKAEFANAADGWLVAHAKFKDFVVVTHETEAPDAQSKVKLPDVCNALEVKYVDTFEMLQDLQASFHWKP